MPRINREEYKILKGLDDRWKWIARDGENQIYSAEVYIFERKPEREDGYWNNTGNREYAFLRGRDASFQFIKWEDEEPHNIAELIEEYEDSKEYKDSLVIEYFMDKPKKSEETEVKDIKWANGEIKKVRDLLNNKRYEEEVDDFTTGVLSGLRKALDILDQLDEPELPVIPKFVAEWVEESKPYNSLREAFEYIAQQKKDNHNDEQLAFWVEEGNSETFARAWLDGYTVEEEQKYRVIDSHKVYLLAKEEDRNEVETVAKFVEIYGYNHAELDYNLTEQEIKDYDERYFAFAVKVEELEE